MVPGGRGFLVVTLGWPCCHYHRQYRRMKYNCGTGMVANDVECRFPEQSLCSSWRAMDACFYFAMSCSLQLGKCAVMSALKSLPWFGTRT